MWEFHGDNFQFNYGSYGMRRQSLGIYRKVETILDRHQAIIEALWRCLKLRTMHTIIGILIRNLIFSFLIKKNVKGKKGKENIISLLDDISYTRLDVDYNDVITTLRQFN